MKPPKAVLPVILLIAVASLAPAGGAGRGHPLQLTFSQRVEAQRAIERVYYDHQIDNPVPFEEAVSEETLRAKVRTYLKQSVALDRLWHTPVTAEMLRAEAARMQRQSRMPERLAELRHALDDDPVLIEECLARPMLVDRLTRSFFEGDARWRSASGGKVGWEDWWHEVEADFDENEAETVSQPPDASMAPAPRTLTPPSCRQFDWQNGGLDDPEIPAPHSGHRAIWTGSLMITWSDNEVAGDRYDPATDTWQPVTYVNAPSQRFLASVVWAGNVMIVWGGTQSSFSYYNTGSRYDPVTNAWTTMTNISAPEARGGHTAVWTGQAMLVSGGTGTVQVGPHLVITTGLNGGSYYPAIDRWTTGPSFQRTGHSAVWTGTQLLLWGGSCQNVPATYPADGCPSDDPRRGTVYDIPDGTWHPMTTTGAPSSPGGHSVWTGSRMVIWGGSGPSSGRYDPVTDTWQTVSTINAPAGIAGSTAVWDGSRMIVWGGSNGTGPVATGARYDPVGDAWTQTSNVNAPGARTGHSTVWTGTRMIVWGGSNGTAVFTSGARYDPASDSWTPTSASPFRPKGRSGHFAVWTGSLMIVWGGSLNDTSGGRYDPALDAWTPTSLTGAPSGRVNTAAVWAGGRLVIWGGYDGTTTFDTGGRYDPVADAWSTTSATGAPSRRELHVAVSTGSRMIVWGGRFTNCSPGPSCTTTWYRDGGVYDPASDSWTLVNSNGAPTGRTNETAVWSGSRMIVWGGADSTIAGYPGFNTGGLYDPAANVWGEVTVNGAPPGRRDHVAVWTGSEMIIWGGVSTTPPPCGCFTSIHTDGGRYNPATNTWTTVSSAGAPTSVNGTAIWTGDEMIVWGGSSNPNSSIGINTGSRYNVQTDTWTATPVTGAPPARYAHSAVWTGSRMIVWGGFGSAGLANTGGQLVQAPAGADADGDGFGSCDCDDTHASVYPGAPQICGDGLNNDCSSPGWPSLAGTNERDDDGDGLTECAGDCDDAHASVRPGAPQVCDGLNNDCNAAGWPAAPANESDADGDGQRICGGDCDDTSSNVYPGAPQICDGMNNDCNAPGWPAVPPNEADADGDLRRICNGDCDDTKASVYPGAPQLCDGINNDCQDPSWPAVPASETDADGDGVPRVCGGDCDDTRATVYPGAPEICDGLNNNCSTPGWPALPPVEADSDGDGFKVCQGDCSDNNPATYPGAPEINDGSDNECAGSAGYGVTDEISGEAGFASAAATGHFCWTPQAAATSYTVARAANPRFSGACSRLDPGGAACLDDAATPAPGGILYYLVRPLAPYVGSWGQDSTGAERQGVCNGLFTFTFIDAPGDSIAAGALTGFFSSMPAPLPTDYIFFEIRQDNNVAQAWCAERADFYRNAYLSLAAGGGTATSGSWSKWSRPVFSGWSGPDTAGYMNFFGSDCGGAGAWCSESGLGGLGLDIMPSETNTCEALDEAYGCGNGAWRLTIRVGADRATACGF